MASDEVITSLWEIANNEDEIIERNDFEVELNNSVYGKIKELTESNTINNISDEYDRALLIILSQANSSSKSLGMVQGGRFVISQEIISKAVKTVKYENMFIPNTDEYNKRVTGENSKLELKEIILTVELFDKMISNFDTLSLDEKNFLWDNYENLSREEQEELENANINDLDNLAKENEGTEIGKISKIAGEMARRRKEIKESNLDEDTRQQYIQEVLFRDKKFIEFLSVEYESDEWRKLSSKKIIDLYSRFSGREDAEFSEMIKREGKGKFTPESQRKYTEYFQRAVIYKDNLENFCEMNPDIPFCKDLLKRTKGIYDILPEENVSFQIIDDSISITSGDEEVDKKEKKYVKKKSSKQQIKIDNYDTRSGEHQEILNTNDENLRITADKIIEKNNENIVSKQFSEQDFSDALSIYKEYFQSADDETLEAISECTPEEIIANIKDDFDDKQNEGEISEETRRVLDAMLEGITSETKDILLDSQKREAFFERIQSELTNQKDRGAITDSEITEMFERASVDLQVAPFEPVREEDVMPPSFIIPPDVVTAIENTEMDIVYLNRNEPLEVDEGATRAANEALEKGEDVEEAISKYYREKQAEKASLSQEQNEEKAEKEEEKADSIPEIVVVDETQESMEQDNSLDGNSQMPEELTNEIPVKDDAEGKKNENFVVMKKGKDGKIQVLRPMQFFKKSGVTLEQVEEEYTIFKEAVKETLREENEQSQNNENNMNLENEDARE